MVQNVMNFKSHGFTLVELMITVALSAIVLSFAVPSMSYLIRSNSVIAVNNNLVGDIRYARSEAIKRNAAVTVCVANNNFNNCVLDSNNWSGGWVVVVESVARNGNLEAGETILRMTSGIDDSIDVRSSNATGNNLVGGLSFGGDGFPVIPDDGAAPVGEFLLCVDNKTLYSSRIEVNATGRLRSAGSTADCTSGGSGS